jgi:hypothetical protein
MCQRNSEVWQAMFKGLILQPIKESQAEAVAGIITE